MASIRQLYSVLSKQTSVWPRHNTTRKYRWFIATLLVLAIVGIAYLGSLLIWLLSQLRWRYDLTWYDLGWNGFAPTVRYNSFDHQVPSIEFLQQDARCSQEDIFLAPRGPLVSESGGVILDAAGDLIWLQTEKTGDTQDFRVQGYFGKKYLTFWAGSEVEGRKQGSWFMMDETYTMRHSITPGGNYTTGDMHEFEITADDTALITIYQPIPADLSSIGGPADGYLLDSIFQEIIISSGEVLFEWSAYYHVPLNKTFRSVTPCKEDPNSAFNGCGNSPDAAFDYHHLNSIEKDDLGNYLVSARNTHTVSYIDGLSGEILWNLGGQDNEFQDLSDGDATDFSWQHHARWYEFGKSITLFDNGASTALDPARESRGVVIDLDIDGRTAASRISYYNPQQMRSLSQGDLQILDDTGNVFIGWGRSAAFTEFGFEGEVLCDARFGASLFFLFGPVTSYRVFRDTWVGKPNTLPSIADVDGTIYVSWNGATEVSKWQLEGTDDEGEDAEFFVISQTFRDGFETAIQIPTDDQYDFVRVRAMSANDTILGTSEVIEYISEIEWVTPIVVVVITSVAMIVGFLAALVVAAIVYRRSKREQEGSNGYELLGDQDIIRYRRA